MDLLTIGEKIDFLFPREGAPKVTIPTNLSRESLMSRKVMLNQSVHYQSQVLPFSYAINISMQDLLNEVTELKSLFQ